MSSTAAAKPDYTPFGLVHPADRPDSDILVFDGHCKFCIAQMKRIAAMDRHGTLSYMSLHDPAVYQRWPDLDHDELMKRMYLIEPNGKKHPGAASLRYLSRKLPSLWLLAPLMHIPGSLPVWQFLYNQVARIRYRFGRLDECDDGSCKIHFE